jgi:tRNA (cmo5U34)-methyltransferase
MTSRYRDVKAAFDASASSYDALRRQLIPCFDDFYGTVARVMPFAETDVFNVLDLGAGTGLLTALLRQQFPNARCTLVDISDEMLAKAHERFPDGDVRIIVADYSQEPLPGRFDAIVSALSIHHLTDPDKTALFRRIYEALNPGGIFVNADEVKGPTPALDRFYWEEWEREIIARGIDPAEVVAAKDRMTHDIPATLRRPPHLAPRRRFLGSRRVPQVLRLRGLRRREGEIALFSAIKQPCTRRFLTGSHPDATLQGSVSLAPV